MRLVNFKPSFSPKKKDSSWYTAAVALEKRNSLLSLQRVIERDHTDYEPLFVQMAGDSFESALADIPPKRKYIFFIDDAHDFIDNLGGIRILLNSPGYSESKAVLITRKPFKKFLKGGFLAALPDGAIAEREIPKLSLEKTKEFIRAYAQIPDVSLLTGLAQIGAGYAINCCHGDRSTQ